MNIEQTSPSPGIVVIGTDTEIGKTYASTCLIQNLKGPSRLVGAFKPVASGTDPGEPQSDASQLRTAILDSQPWRTDVSHLVCPQEFPAPLAPPLAAELASTKLSIQSFVKSMRGWDAHCDFLVVETAGGLLSPITWHETNAELCQEIGMPTILVVPNRLGCLHQMLSTLVAAERFHLQVAAILLNDLEQGLDIRWEQHARLYHSIQKSPILKSYPPLFRLRHGHDKLAPDLIDVVLAAAEGRRKNGSRT